MKTTSFWSKVFLMAAFCSPVLGCGPRTEIEFNGLEFASEDAIFVSGSVTLDLDGDGLQNDSFAFLSILISEKLSRGAVESTDLCELVSQVNAAQGDLSAVAAPDLIFIQVTKQELNQTGAIFGEEESLVGEALTDANGGLIDGAISVSTLIKRDALFFNIFSPGFGTLDIKQRRDSLEANFIDAPSIQVQPTGEFNEVEFSVSGSLERASLCPALSTFSPNIL